MESFRSKAGTTSLGPTLFRSIGPPSPFRSGSGRCRLPVPANYNTPIARSRTSAHRKCETIAAGGRMTDGHRGSQLYRVPLMRSSDEPSLIPDRGSTSKDHGAGDSAIRGPEIVLLLM